MNKSPSEIRNVTLNDATFHSEAVSFAAVTFFFGNNGTGKSTIARALTTQNGITWNPGRQAGDYSFHLYNRSFVEDNLRSSTQIAGVFTLDQQNIQVEDEIAQATTQLTEQKNKRNSAIEKYNGKTAELESLERKVLEDCWEKTAEIRKRFPKTHKGTLRNKQKFFDIAQKQKSASEHDLEEVNKLYAIAFDAEAKTYPCLASQSTALPETDLLGKQITSSASTSYAQFVRDLGALGWIEQGHEDYGTQAGDHCPYCAQKLPPDFEEQLAASIDEAYRADIAALKDFSVRYDTITASLLRTPKSHDITDLLPGVDLAQYDTQLDLLRVTIETNRKTVATKIQQPATPVALEPLAPIIQKINQLIDNANTLIDEHNTVVNNQRSQQKTCTQQVWERIAFDLKDKFSTYRTEKAALEVELTSLDDEKTQANTQINELERTINDLKKKTVNTTQTMQTINKLLRDTGFEGFELREKPDTPYVYEVIRPNGEIAERLSEGERNFIAFLYFYFQLQGSLTSTGDLKDRIVIIDDPVSSMDNGVLFIVAALVRELVNITLNNWGPATGTSGRDHIKQIFVLTHNAYFFREATYNRVADYETVSYFLVRKRNNQSTVIPCIRYRHDAPSLPENYSPVTNAYATLWQEYKEVSSSATLLNVMRRILEHYFLQLCGHDGADLRTHILENNRDKFITEDETGSEDLTELRQAESILAYLNHEMTGLGDDIFYIEQAADTDTCRKVFQRIFTCMGQEQHYNMMMQSPPTPRRSSHTGRRNTGNKTNRLGEDALSSMYLREAAALECDFADVCEIMFTAHTGETN